MAIVALRRPSPAAEPVGGESCLRHFGPAKVIAVLDREVELELSGPPISRSWARLAIPIAYRPQVGDVVLAIGDDRDCYVIGVLEGHGPTVLEAQGDLELRAQHGAIQITAREGCTVASPMVQVSAATLDLRGGTLREEFETVRRWVSGMLDVRANAICTAVANTYRLTARRIFGHGEDSVAIDAPSINLG
jgi:hypothetical protein